MSEQGSNNYLFVITNYCLGNTDTSLANHIKQLSMTLDNSNIKYINVS